MKKQYIAPISEKVFPEPLMGGWNPGTATGAGGLLLNGSGATGSGTGLSSGHIICAPGRDGLKYL